MAKSLFIFAISKAEDGKWTIDGKPVGPIACNMICEPYTGLRIILGAYAVMVGTQTEQHAPGKLRAALERIAAGDGVYGAQAWEYKQIAREALGQTSLNATGENDA